MAENKENRAFQMMRQDALHMLSGKDPFEIAENAKVTYDETRKEFLISSLGRIYHFGYPSYEAETEMDMWHHLIVLHYLNLSDGTPAAGVPVTMGELPDGLVRGGKFDQTASRELCEFLKKHSEEEVQEILQQLGGEVINGKADLSVRLSFLPSYPVYLNIWFADEEFPPSAKMLVDKNSWHYLSIEDAVSVGDVILRILQSWEK